jgi:ubiquinone/menaquinone biosynthesis C-methylase UbiE
MDNKQKDLEEYLDFINYYIPPEAKILEADNQSANLTRLPFIAGGFDAVIAKNILEHATDVSIVLNEFLRVLKPGGLLLIHSRNFLSAKHMLDAYRNRSGLTFEGQKSSRQLLRQALKSIRLLISRTITNRPKFIYRQPSKDFKTLGSEATVYLNPLDLRLTLEKLGAKIISYQSVKHFNKATWLKKIGSIFFGDHMGVIRIVASKSARYERH